MNLVLHFLCLASLSTAIAFLSRDHQLPIHQLKDLDVPGDSSLVYCDDPEDDILSIDKADLTPNDLKPGANVTLKITGDLSEQVKNGSTVTFQVKFRTAAGSVPLLKEEADLCEELDEKCPVDEGSVEFSKNVSIPKDVPGGTYLVRVEAESKDEERITCVEAEVAF